MSGLTPDPVEIIHVEPPDIERLDSKDFTLSYDALADTLFIYFVAGEVNPVSVLLDPDSDVYALVDAVSREVVGIQLEAYLQQVVYEWPELLALALWAGIPPERLEPVVEKVTQQATAPDNRRDTQRRFFDLSIKEQIQHLFHAPGNHEVVATA